MIAFVIFANLPDLDFVAGYLFTGDVHRFHSGPSHSFVFALLCTLLISLLVHPDQRRIAMPWIGLAVLSHVLIDLFGGPLPGWHESYGVPFFWPLDDQRVRMSFSLFFGIEHATVEKLFSLHNVIAVVAEIVTFGIPFLLLQRWARLRAARFVDSGKPA